MDLVIFNIIISLYLLVFHFSGMVSIASVVIAGHYANVVRTPTEDAYLFFSVSGFVLEFVLIILVILYFKSDEKKILFYILSMVRDCVYGISLMGLSINCAKLERDQRYGSYQNLKNTINIYANYNYGAYAAAAFFGFSNIILFIVHFFATVINLIKNECENKIICPTLPKPSRNQVKPHPTLPKPSRNQVKPHPTLPKPSRNQVKPNPPLAKASNKDTTKTDNNKEIAKTQPSLIIISEKRPFTAKPQNNDSKFETVRPSNFQLARTPTLTEIERLQSTFDTFRFNLDISHPEYIHVKQKTLSSIKVDSNTNYKTFTIERIEKLVNEKLLKRYEDHRTELQTKYNGDANEQFFFHGSPAIETILHKGFDINRANKNGRFGAGLYFAEHSSKSHQYTNRCIHNEPCGLCERYLLYCRVCLGKIKEVTSEVKYNSAPGGYDSVKDTVGLSNFPEYIVYKEEQIYPEYKIAYKVVPK